MPSDRDERIRGAYGDVEEVLQAYESMGMTRLAAIRAAVQEEKLERDDAGKLRLRPVTLQPGRRLLGI